MTAEQKRHEIDVLGKGIPDSWVQVFKEANGATPFIMPAIELRVGRAILTSIIATEGSWADVVRGPNTAQKLVLIEEIQRIHKQFGLDVTPTSEQIDTHWEMDTEHIWDTSLFVVHEGDSNQQDFSDARMLDNFFGNPVNRSRIDVLQELYKSSTDALKTDASLHASSEWRKKVLQKNRSPNDFFSACRSIFVDGDAAIDSSIASMIHERGIVVPSHLSDKFRLKSFYENI